MKKIFIALSVCAHVNAVEIIGHRGALSHAPENTVCSFQAAWELGVDAVEGDFWLTKDGHVVCSHDPNHLDIDITASTLEEIRGVYPMMPTLEEVLATVPPGKKFYIEIKRGVEIVPYVKAIIEKSGLSSEQITLLSFDRDVVRANCEHLPYIQNFYSLFLTPCERQRPHQRGKSPAELLEQAMELGANGLCVECNRDKIEEILALQEEPLPWVVWTVDNVEEARTFCEMGAQGIITNIPEEMTKIFSPHDYVFCES